MAWQYDQTSWSAREWMPFALQRLSVQLWTALADEAQRRWVQLYPEDMVDDCTIIVVHLKPPKANTLGRAGRRRSSILIDNADHVRLEAGAKKTSEEKAE